VTIGADPYSPALIRPNGAYYLLGPFGTIGGSRSPLKRMTRGRRPPRRHVRNVLGLRKLGALGWMEGQRASSERMYRSRAESRRQMSAVLPIRGEMGSGHKRKTPGVGTLLEAAIGVEPMIEVLQLSDGDDGAWPSVRESAAPSKVLRRLGHRQSLSVVDGDEVSRQQHVGR
jgi:hypothetical protein